MKNKVSFVILSHNDSSSVIRAIGSIKKLKTTYSYDIYVVDNGSRDNTPEIIRKKFRNVNLITVRKNIGTAAYDAAIKKSGSEYIFFTGCDVELKQDMLDKLVNLLDKNNDAMQAAPKYVSIKDKKTIDLAGTWLSRSFYSGTFKKGILGKNIVEIPYIGTGLIRKSFIDKHGYLFDNDYFFYGEDVDLGMRIRLAGFKVFYVPDAIVYHVGSTSRKIFSGHFLTFLMERNLMRTFISTLSLSNVILFSPYVLLMRLIAMSKDIATLKFLNAFARAKAILWIILNPIPILRKRTAVQKLRKISDKELLKHFTEKYLINV